MNGEPRRLPAPATLLDLLASLDLDPRTVVVELNGEIVRRPRSVTRRSPTATGSRLVHFVGGG